MGTAIQLSLNLHFHVMDMENRGRRNELWNYSLVHGIVAVARLHLGQSLSKIKQYFIGPEFALW